MNVSKSAPLFTSCFSFPTTTTHTHFLAKGDSPISHPFPASRIKSRALQCQVTPFFRSGCGPLWCDLRTKIIGHIVLSLHCTVIEWDRITPVNMIIWKENNETYTNTDMLLGSSWEGPVIWR